MLTTYETDADILRAVEAGATGYLLKDATPAQLANAVRAAARGDTVLAPSVAERLVTHVRRPPRESLSARETEILTQVARGRTNAEIGRALFISEATVKTHLLHVPVRAGVQVEVAKPGPAQLQLRQRPDVAGEHRLTDPGGGQRRDRLGRARQRPDQPGYGAARGGPRQRGQEGIDLCPGHPG